MRVLAVALDLVREAAARRWILALAIAVTVALITLGVSLQLDVVDGALAATRLFGRTVDTSIRAADVVLRPVFEGAAYLVFYGGLGTGILLTADFAPSLLSPGRIELLLSLPVRRVELLAGTLLGVLCLSSAAALYGAGGVVVILGWKTGVWTAGPLWAALLSSVCFTAIYAAMLTTAVFVRSAAMSAAAGAVFFGLGIVASYRDEIAALLTAGPSRMAFLAFTLPLPRLASLGTAAAWVAGGSPPSGHLLLGLVASALVFGGGAFAVGAWHFERKDY